MSIINILVTNQANAATQLSFARTLKWCKPRKTESCIYVGKSINSLVPSGSISEYGFKLAMWPSQIFSFMVASVINKIHCRTIPHFMWKCKLLKFIIVLQWSLHPLICAGCIFLLLEADVLCLSLHSHAHAWQGLLHSCQRMLPPILKTFYHLIAQLYNIIWIVLLINRRSLLWHFNCDFCLMDRQDCDFCLMVRQDCQPAH